MCENNINSRKEVNFWSSFEKISSVRLFFWGQPTLTDVLVSPIFYTIFLYCSRVLGCKQLAYCWGSWWKAHLLLPGLFMSHWKGLRSVLFLLFLLISLFFLLLFLFLSLCLLAVDKDGLHPCKLFPVPKTLFFWLMFLNGFASFLSSFPDREVFTYSGDKKWWGVGDDNREKEHF